MKRPDLTDKIITSAEAKTFLSMVTKGFYNSSYVGLWIFEVIGREWDELREWAEGVKNEIHPQTCTWTIDIWEWVYGIEPDPSLDLEFRRQRILAKIRSVRPINPEALRRGIAALIGTGPEGVEVHDLTGPYRFEVILHPGNAPFYYDRIDRYIWETKPSHLAFETIAETSSLIHVIIGTEYFLAGFGLTGQYNTGTHPDIQYRARLYDPMILVNAGEKSATITNQPAGSFFATEEGTTKQRMPAPSTAFLQDNMQINVLPDASGYLGRHPITQDKNSEAGRYPGTSITAKLEGLTIIASAEEKAAGFTHPKTGTVPDTQIRFSQTNADIHAQLASGGYEIMMDPAGIKPQDAIHAELQAMILSAKTDGAGYQVPSRETSKDSTNTGTYPGTQVQGEKPIGGILPIITTESFTIRYPLCGTETTKSNS